MGPTVVASLVVAARETLEGSLLIGVFLAYLAKTDNRRYGTGVWLGVGLAAAASVLLGIALFLTAGDLAGRAGEAFEGGVMWSAAGVLTYVLWWMGRHGHSLGSAVRAGAGAAVERGSMLAIVVLAFLAVFREGGETVLYLAAAAGTSPWSEVAAGASAGAGTAALAGFAIYRGGTRYLDPRLFFRVTTVVLLVFAAGLVGRATLAFQAAGLFPGTIPAWDLSGVLPETSGPGALLRALVGYTATPSLLQVIFWLAYVALVVSLATSLGRMGRAARPSPLGMSYDHPLYRLLRRPGLTKALSAAMGLVFAFLLAVALFGIAVGPFDGRGVLRLGSFVGGENGNSLFNFALWIVWLPLLSILTVLLGRVWCGNLCPLRLVTDSARRLADRVVGRGSRAAPYVRLGWVLPAAFILVTFVVKWLPVQRTARYGAILFLVIFALAAGVGFVFRRGAWCRYFCPVGGWLARITRLSPLTLSADPDACVRCEDKPCLTGTALAGRCPAYLNPSRLESDRNCLKCWSCVVNCPLDRSSLKVGWRLPGAELLEPRAPDLWESVFVASLLGMYAAAGHRSPELAGLAWPLLFFGLVLLATLAYGALCALAAPVAGISFRRALTTFGYAFLPLEFATAVIAFGDDALEFLGIAQPAAAVLLAVGFIWSVVLVVSILRNQCRSGRRALAAAVPVGAALVAILFVWLGWYASGAVVDLT